MTLVEFEEKHGLKRVSLDKFFVGIEVGPDKSDVRRLDALKIDDYSVKFFRTKWAVLEKIFQGYCGSEWCGY